MSEELLGQFQKTRFVKADSGWMIGTLSSGETVVGVGPKEGLIPGLSYRFLGRWEDSDYGRQFAFRAVVTHSPTTRSGVVKYLEKHAQGIGPRLAHRLIDQFGVEVCVAKLKNQPSEVAAALPGLSLDDARAASAELRRLEKFQQTHMDLLVLIGGRGFGQQAIDACIQTWGVHAPGIIRRDPFKLLTAKIPGAGFLRCDQLWHAFGLKPDRMKRQVMAVWSHLRNDSSGSTWHAKNEVLETVKKLITGRSRPSRAVTIAIIAGVIVEEEHDGQLWIAEAGKAADERGIDESLRRLCA